MNKPLCFVLMPFGKKPDGAGMMVDFDAVYSTLIAPAIEEAGLEALRDGEEMTGEIIHKPLFERLILCEYAVADLTTANANVFYELGLRHAVRPQSTVLIFSEGSRLQFDVSHLGALPYGLNTEGVPREPDKDRKALSARLAESRQSTEDNQKEVADSPIYQLVENFTEIGHTKTDVFRERVRYSGEIKAKLAEARTKGVEALRQIESELGDIKDEESGVVIDLFLSYRSVKAWDEMIALVEKMSRPLAATVMVQEQLGLALNRAGRGEDAERLIKELLKRRGPSSETYGVLGRIYKDRWDAAVKDGETFLAHDVLDKAIDAYLRGFESDWRDAYPGINTVTLMELREPPDSRREQLLPVVSYAVERRIATGRPDYWDYASRIELAVLALDEERAKAALGDALAAVRESWEPETTAHNLRLIIEARERRQDSPPWVNEIEKELNKRAQQ